MTDRELMQQALDVLMDAQLHNYALKHKETDDLITALRERLAQPEPWEQFYPDMGNPFQPQRTHWEGCDEVHPECRKPEQEPVAFCYLRQTSSDRNPPHGWAVFFSKREGDVPLYTAPPRRAIRARGDTT